MAFDTVGVTKVAHIHNGLSNRAVGVARAPRAQILYSGLQLVQQEIARVCSEFQWFVNVNGSSLQRSDF